MTDENAAFATLWHPFQAGAIDWRERYLFFRARSGLLPPQVKTADIDCLQSFKPLHDDLQSSGFNTLEKIDRSYSGVLVLTPPQRDETRAIFARAFQATSHEGVVVVSMQNNAGAKSGENDLRQLAPDVQSLSKNKCRVFWAGKRNLDETLLHQWLKLDEPRYVEDIGFVSRPGIFAWNRIDAASRLLAHYLPGDLSGQGADLGAGLGYLSHVVLDRCEKIAAMDVYEAEARALECAQSNLSKFEGSRKIKYHWQDVSRGIQGVYDFIVSNPPFHEGRTEVQTLGQAFIEVAARALKPGGRFYMVANRHLPYEASLQKNFSQIAVLAMQDGYKVFEARK